MTEEPKEFILAYCGLVCSECGAYTKGRCKGCHSDKPMNKGCKVRFLKKDCLLFTGPL